MKLLERRKQDYDICLDIVTNTTFEAPTVYDSIIAQCEKITMYDSANKVFAILFIDDGPSERVPFHVCDENTVLAVLDTNIRDGKHEILRKVYEKFVGDITKTRNKTLYELDARNQLFEIRYVFRIKDKFVCQLVMDVGADDNGFEFALSSRKTESFKSDRLISFDEVIDLLERYPELGLIEEGVHSRRNYVDAYVLNKKLNLGIPYEKLYSYDDDTRKFVNMNDDDLRRVVEEIDDEFLYSLYHYTPIDSRAYDIGGIISAICKYNGRKENLRMTNEGLHIFMTSDTFIDSMVHRFAEAYGIDSHTTGIEFMKDFFVVYADDILKYTTDILGDSINETKDYRKIQYAKTIFVIALPLLRHDYKKTAGLVAHSIVYLNDIVLSIDALKAVANYCETRDSLRDKVYNGIMKNEPLLQKAIKLPSNTKLGTMLRLRN